MDLGVDDDGLGSGLGVDVDMGALIGGDSLQADDVRGIVAELSAVANGATGNPFDADASLPLPFQQATSIVADTATTTSGAKGEGSRTRAVPASCVCCKKCVHVQRALLLDSLFPSVLAHTHVVKITHGLDQVYLF